MRTYGQDAYMYINGEETYCELSRQCACDKIFNGSWSSNLKTSVPDSLPKGGGESGTVACTGICIPLNFRGKNLIGSMACGTSNGGLSVEKCTWSIVIQLFI